MGSTAQPEDISMTRLSKTFLALSVAIMLVATCAALAKIVTAQGEEPVVSQRALTVEGFPELFNGVWP